MMDRLPAPPREVTDCEIDAVLDEFDGDIREAIRALLSDIDVLAPTIY